MGVTMQHSYGTFIYCMSLIPVWYASVLETNVNSMLKVKAVSLLNSDSSESIENECLQKLHKSNILAMFAGTNTMMSAEVIIPK